MNASQRPFTLVAAIAVALLASACAAGAVSQGPTSGPATVPSAALVAQPTATSAATPLAASSFATRAPSTTPDPTSGSGATPPVTGALAPTVIGAGTYPGVTVVAPQGWQVSNGSFVDPPSGPVLGVSVWDVGQVPRNPCHWQGHLYDPGQTVDDLVRALVAAPLRHASKPTDVTLAGYSGQYFEWSVPSTMVVTGDSDFKGCDADPSSGHLDFVSWFGNGKGERYQQVAGQVDRVWVLDVKGQRLVVDATHTPAATKADLAAQGHIVESLRFVTP